MTETIQNPLLRKSILPYGLPEFDQMDAKTYREALLKGMQIQLDKLDELAADDSPATPENTLHVWEEAAVVLRRAQMAFFSVHSSYTNDDLDELHAEIMPKLAAHADQIFLNRALYQRFQALAERAENGEVTLDEQDAWALAELLRQFRRQGIELDDDQQARLREINQELAKLSTTFSQNVLGARNAGALEVSEKQLAGLSDGEKESLKTEDGTYRIELINTTVQPLMSKLDDARTRAKLFSASLSRGWSGKFDNRQVVIDTARLRAERAQLLGYEHHAALIAEKGCAKTTTAVNQMMRQLAAPALEKAKAEAAELAELYQELTGDEFQASDWAWTAAKARARKFDFDEADYAEYLQVEKVLAAVYQAATDLYGITFHPLPNLVGHTPDAEVFEVREADGTPIGLFVMDFWARPNKKGGAWMTSLVVQSELFDELPVVTNNCNYTPSTTTITWDGVITMFHEFGHALHGLFSRVRYPSHSGTGGGTPRDFVEFPSQVNEHWAWQPGRVLPAEALEKLEQARQFGEGFSTVEVLAATLLDQSWHQTPLEDLPSDPDEVEEFERAALGYWGLDYDLIYPRYRTTYFSHIWGGGYDAGYYGYKWSEVMDADAVVWFNEHGGGTRENGDHFRNTLLAPGGRVDPMETYRSFRGRDPEVGPLLERLGLAAD